MTERNALATVEAREAHPLVVGIQQRMPAIAQMLPAGMDTERFQRVAIQAIIKQPDILQCSPESVIAAIVEAAQDGLEPTGARGGAHLVKFGSEAVLIRDYRGIIRIIVESGAATRVDAHVVRQGDVFSLDHASPDPVVHRPDVDAEGEARGYYALFWLPDGTKKAEYMTVDQIEQVRATSRGKDSMGWTKFFDQMARKTVIKRGANYLNLRPDIRERLTREDAAEFEGPIISVQRDERIAASRARIHERAARLTGGATEQPAEGETAEVHGFAEASTTPRPADAPSCAHPAAEHQATDAGVVCGQCGQILARRDPGEADARAASPTPQPVQSRRASPPGPSSAAPASPSLAVAQQSFAAAVIGQHLVPRLDGGEKFWKRAESVMSRHNVELPPDEEAAQVLAEWDALTERVLAGEFAK